MGAPIRNTSPPRGWPKSTKRLDVKQLEFRKALISLGTGQYFREGAKEWYIYDDFGKVRAFPKVRGGKQQIMGVVT